MVLNPPQMGMSSLPSHRNLRYRKLLLTETCSIAVV